MGGKHGHPKANPLAHPVSPPARVLSPVSEAEVEAVAERDFEEWAAWVDREIAAGRDPFPPERSLAQGISISLGAAAGIDPELLAALSDPGYESGEFGQQFGQGAAADVLPPGPVLAALTEAAVADVTQLSDNQLVGVLQAARRQENREAWKKALVIAEFARRRVAEFEAAKARGVPVHCRPGQFPGEELALEMVLGPVQASHAIDDATDLVTRLPKTLAGMAAGLIDESRAGVIALHTRSLSLADAALADDILAALALELRLDQLMYKACALEKKLNPEAVKARRERARRTLQRVEVRREESGNGPTDQCNLGPKCRRHHKAKQSPGWKVEQPEPGITRWTLPNGRTHTTKPTIYSLGVLRRSCLSAGRCATLAGSCIRGGARWRLRRLRVGPTAPRPRRLPCR